MTSHVHYQTNNLVVDLHIENYIAFVEFGGRSWLHRNFRVVDWTWPWVDYFHLDSIAFL